MHQNPEKCFILVIEYHAKHGGKQRSKYNAGDPISSFGIEWCLFSQNPHISDSVFSNKTLSPPSFRNLVVNLLALRLSAMDV